LCCSPAVVCAAFAVQQPLRLAWPPPRLGAGLVVKRELLTAATCKNNRDCFSCGRRFFYLFF
jgi:hypothetical protein